MKPLKDKKIIIYRGNSSGPDPNSIAYTPIHPGKLWAYVRQISSKEYYLLVATEIEEEIMFTVNWRPDLTALSSKGTYVCYNGNWYNVTRVDTYEGYRDDVKLYCKSMPAPRAEEVRGF